MENYQKRYIGKKIKHLRNKYNLSQKRFGHKLGLSAKTISAYENGKISPPYKVLNKIAKVYNSSLIELSEQKTQELASKLNLIENTIKELRETYFLANEMKTN